MVRKKKDNDYDAWREYAKHYVPNQYAIPFQTGWVPPPPPVTVPPETYAKANPFEPQNFDEFIGQKFAKEILKIIVDSANKEHRLIPSVLLTGAYGHGKTTLAKLVVQRHGKRVCIVDGSNVLTQVIPSKETIYIVDEAHNIPPQLADTYNILMDSNNLRMIACTNKPGMLPAPFRSRFRSVYLGDYTPENIKEIIQNAARRSETKLSEGAAVALAKRSKLNPRYGLNLLDFMREISVLEESSDDTIREKDVLVGVEKLNIDPLGLTELDRKYLSLLKPNGAIGLNYISSALSLDADTIQDEIEPYLIQLGLVERTPRGRVAGQNHVISEITRKILEEAELPT
jgi:Holliday junction DNA helicase RuvB